MKKRITSLLLSLVMVFSLLPQGIVFAAGNTTPTIKASSTSALAGGTVSLDISIANNPGILGATLTLSYDEGLILQSVKSGDAFGALTFTKPGKFTSPCNFVWDAQELDADEIKDGVILTLTFEVSDSVVAGKMLNVRLSCKDSDISDVNLHSVHVDTVNGGVSVIDYIPGDVDSDGVVNTTDVIKLRRYLAGGYDLTINEPAGNVNRDQYRNTTDVIWMRRFLAGGYTDPTTGEPLQLWPESQCDHALEAIPYKAPTTTESGNNAYWHCTKCGKNFSDAEGTTETNPYLPPISPDGKEYSIQYMPGMYNGNDSNAIVNLEPGNYRSGTVTVLPSLKMDTYDFVGWSDQNGNLYSDGRIPANVSGDLILTGNWVSQRNRARPVSSIDKPLVVEDLDNQQILFCYEIGTIENVPLYTIENLLVVNGLLSYRGEEVNYSFSEQQMESVGTSISKETTESTQVTLSNELSERTDVSNEYLEQTGRDRERTETEARSQSVTHELSLSSGGSSSRYQYNDSTHKNETNQGYVVNKNLDTGISHELTTGIKNTTEVSAGVSFPVEIVKVNAGVKNTTEISAGTKTNTHLDYSVGSTQTWDNHTYDETHQENSKTDNKYWNSSASLNTAQTVSSSEIISDAFHEMVAETYRYGKSYTKSTVGTEGRGVTSASGQTQNVSNTVVYTTKKDTITTTSFSSNGNTFGGYRLVMAGTMHVFAVVGYDIASKDYFVYTYNVMGDGSVVENGKDDGFHQYLDYSYDRTFSDYENCVLPVEIPKYVDDYVNSRIVYTEGLEYTFNNRNHTATVRQYSGEDTVVYVPSYMVDENGTAFKVTGISSNAFRNQTNLEAVSLGRFVSEIPASAFEGCTSLEYVVCPAVTHIRDRAFYGCTSLKEFKISKQVVFLGDNAFVNVPSVVAEVGYDEEHPEYTSLVAKAAAGCGAKKLTLNLSESAIPKNMNLPLVVPQSDAFTLTCGGKSYSDLTLISHAATTSVERVSIEECAEIPFVFYSDSVALYAVDVEGVSSYVMTLRGQNDVSLLLSGTNTFDTANDTAIVCRGVNVAYTNSGVLNVGGDIKHFGTINDSNHRVSFTQGMYRSITDEDEYNSIIEGAFTITFDANGGTSSQSSKTVYSGSPIGALPTAARDYYTFDGWYTAASGGEKVSTDWTGNMDITLYAHWSLNPVSEWVLESNMPADAQQLDEKWAYDEIEYTESRETSLPDYAQYDSYWVESGRESTFYSDLFPEGFDSSHWIYTNFAKSAYSAYENETNKREVQNNWAGFVYWHWTYNVSYANTTERMVSSRYGLGYYVCQYFDAFTSSVDCSSLSNSAYYNYASQDSWMPTYYVHDIMPSRDGLGKGTPRYFRFDYGSSTAIDYYKVFKYYRHVWKESDSPVYPSSTISSIEHWVKYRAK